MFCLRLWVMLVIYGLGHKRAQFLFDLGFTSLNLFFGIQDTWWTVICSRIDYHQLYFVGSTSWYQSHSFRAVQVDLRQGRVVDWGDCFLPFRFSGSWGEGLGLLTNMAPTRSSVSQLFLGCFGTQRLVGEHRRLLCPWHWCFWQLSGYLQVQMTPWGPCRRLYIE